MQYRTLGSDLTVSAVGLGCMGMSHAYGAPADKKEMAELLALHVFQYVDYAPRMAFAWIAKDQPLYQICGYHILSRHFASEQIPDERGINEYLDQVETALTGKDLAVRHAAYNSLMRFCDLGEIYESLAQKALQSTGLL